MEFAFAAYRASSVAVSVILRVACIGGNRVPELFSVWVIYFAGISSWYCCWLLCCLCSFLSFFSGFLRLLYKILYSLILLFKICDLCLICGSIWIKLFDYRCFLYDLCIKFLLFCNLLGFQILDLLFIGSYWCYIFIYNSFCFRLFPRQFVVMIYKTISVFKCCV